MKPNATMPHETRIDAPPVNTERNIGGNGRLLEGRPSHEARNARSNSGKHKTGRKKARISSAIFVADTRVLPPLLPLGVSLLSSVTGICGYGRFGFDVGSGVMLVGLKKRRRLDL